MGQLGFIGLGIMGKPMAGHLARAGHTVRVFNRTETPMLDLSKEGCAPCGSSREVAERSEVVFLMVPDTPDVEAVLFGPGGVAAGIREGSVVVDMSTISPTATRHFAERLRAQGVEMLDAPVSGGQVGAEGASLSIMVGGKPEVFERVRPYLELLGKKVVLIGGNGDGQVCKAANQIVAAVTLEGVAEALVFASKAGADVGKVRQALLGGFAGSRILELHGERMIARAFQPGFRVRLHQKDLNLALQAGRELGVALPATACVLQLLNAVAAGGGADLDHSALVMALEKLASHAVAGAEAPGPKRPGGSGR